MKILFVSIPSLHAIRWIENLENSGHELYWFDVLDRGKLYDNPNIRQFVNWKKRKFPYIKGEHFMRKKTSFFYDMIQPALEVTISEEFEKIINEIKPDLVHSFEMQSCSYPIFNIMQKYRNVSWLYSCWGSDLYYYKEFKKHNKKIKKVLNRINFLHTDCFRDFKIAKKLGFRGEFLGVIPGGGGFNLNEFINLKLPVKERNIILVKGYEHKFGRAINVIKALELVVNEIKEFKVIVFGAHQKVIDYVNHNNLAFKVFDRHELSHKELIILMGKANIYIGNSISDGMPNTLLEAIIMNAFPIQSNPGNVTSEIIENEINGLLINNPEKISEIQNKIEQALRYNYEGKFETAANKNTLIANERLNYKINKQKILNLYNKIHSSIKKIN